MPRTLVMHGTLDPKTDFNGALNHIKRLKNSGSVTLLEVTDAPHFIALNSEKCLAEAVNLVKKPNVDRATCEDKNVLLTF